MISFVAKLLLATLVFDTASVIAAPIPRSVVPYAQPPAQSSGIASRNTHQYSRRVYFKHYEKRSPDSLAMGAPSSPQDCGCSNGPSSIVGVVTGLFRRCACDGQSSGNTAPPKDDDSGAGSPTADRNATPAASGTPTDTSGLGSPTGASTPSKASPGAGATDVSGGSTGTPTATPTDANGSNSLTDTGASSPTPTEAPGQSPPGGQKGTGVKLHVELQETPDLSDGRVHRPDDVTVNPKASCAAKAETASDDAKSATADDAKPTTSDHAETTTAEDAKPTTASDDAKLTTPPPSDGQIPPSDATPTPTPTLIPPKAPPPPPSAVFDFPLPPVPTSTGPIQAWVSKNPDGTLIGESSIRKRQLAYSGPVYASHMRRQQ